MLNYTTQKSLRHASGEELLLLAVLGPAHMKPKIDKELDRRAMSDNLADGAALADPFTKPPVYAA